MVGGFHPADSADHCTGGSARGTQALATALLARWEAGGATSLGIYNCRGSSGGGGLSIHAEGRAFDCGVSTGGVKLGQNIFDQLIEHTWQLGIQRIIWNREQYDRITPTGQAYTGPNPHVDHLHIEQTRSAGESLDLATAVLLLVVDDSDGEGMVLVRRLAQPTDTAVWLLHSGKRIAMPNWDQVQAVLNAGGVMISLPDDTLAAIPAIGGWG